MNVLYTARVSIKGGRNGSARSDDERLALPKALGGDGQGTNPEQLFAAGYGACFASTITTIAKNDGLVLEGVEVRAEVDMCLDGAAYRLAARIHVKVPGIAPETVASLVERAKSVCPYSVAIRNNVSTEIRITA